MNKIVNSLLLALVSGFAVAASVPNTFVANTPAVADEVNANFTALTDALTALEDRVAVLEGTLTVADVAGSYTFASLYVHMTGNGTTGTVTTQTGGGTITLNANGTYSMSTTSSGNRLVISLSDNPDGNGTPDGSINRVNVSNPDSGSGTWALSGKSIVLDGSVSFRHAAGGHLFVHTLNSTTIGDRDIQFMVRN